ncbi:MAG: M35 family metallo-endopeptidase [Kofleriaceae bacterium]
MWEAPKSKPVAAETESASPAPRAAARDAAPPAATPPASASTSSATRGGERADAWVADAGLMSAMGLNAPSSSASSARAEYGGGELRARIGQLAEGSHPGVQRGGAGKKRTIGTISGGAFVPAASAPEGAAPEATPASPTAATGKDADRAFVGSPSSRQADRTTTDGTTSVRMEDETNAQALVISAAVTRARQILDNALSQLGSPTAAKVSTALTNNFHSTDAKTVTEVRSQLQKIRNAFNGTIPIEVESEGTARAYVYVIWSDIHLCPPWFADTDPDGRARTIIHECSHKYCGTDDKAYHWNTSAYGALSTKDALNNADSFAWFCIDVL